MLNRLIGDRSVHIKILMVIAVMGLAACGVTAVALRNLAELNRANQEMYFGALRPRSELDHVARDMADTRLAVLDHASSETPDERRRHEQRIAELDAQFAADLDAYAGHSAAPELIDQLRAAWASYRDVRDRQLLPADRPADLVSAHRIRTEVAEPAAARATEVAAQLETIEHADAERRLAASTATYRASRTGTVLVLVISLVLAVGFGLVVGLMIIRALHRVSQVVRGLAGGDLTVRADLGTSDEIGQMAAALDQAISGLGGTIGEIRTNSHTLADAARDLSSVSNRIAQSATDASSRAAMVSSAADQVSRNVDTVSTGAEQMTASIREIATNASDAARIAHHAVDVARHANTTVSRLGESSSEIGAVVAMITSIAEQTNLLALNATIEAARAGEAGKGFAVVASEVKDLAQATSKATEDISRRIQVIQHDTGAAVGAIRQIADLIDQINGYSATIASAVEQQTSTTSEIGRNVGEAAAGATEIARNITTVADAAESTSTGVGESRRAAGDLAHMSTNLRQLVGKFRL